MVDARWMAAAETMGGVRAMRLSRLATVTGCDTGGDSDWASDAYAGPVSLRGSTKATMG